MSLINQMLRDLEDRRAGGMEGSGLQREIRPLPTAAGIKWPLLAGVATAGILAAGVAAWLLLRAPSPPPLVAGPAATVSPAVPILPVQAALPRDTDPAPAGGLRLETALATAYADPVPPSPIPAAPLPAAPAGEKAPAPGRPEVPTAPPPKPPASPKAADFPAQQVAIEKTPSAATPRERAEADYRQALGLAAGGRGGDAVDALQGALRQDAAHAGARQALARLLIEAHRAEEAGAVLREGLELQPAQIGWAMTLARLQVEAGDYGAAGRTLARSAAYAGRSPEYQGFHGHVLQRLGQTREAAGMYQAAVQLAPGEGRWWLGLGLALEAEGQGGEAREAFRRALATGTLAPELAAIAEQRGR